MENKTVKKSVIDIEKWERAEAYYIFKNFEQPYTNLCTDIDITNFMRFIRENDYYFFAALLYYITKAANALSEFRCRLEGDTPVIWNRINANYTLMQDSGAMGNNYTEYTDDFKEFYCNVLKDLAQAKQSGKMINKMLPEGMSNSVVTITSIPWTKLSNFTQAMYKVGDAVPYIGVGRRYGQGERIMLPVAVQAHHAFADGFHVSHYFKLLEMMLSDPRKYSDESISYSVLLKESRPFILSEKEKPINPF